MPTCFWILVVSSPTCLWWKRGPVGHFFWARVTKKWGTAKVARFTVPKKFPGSSKDCKIQSLLCDKASGNSKGSQIHCAKKIFWEQQRLQDSIFTVSGNSKGSKIHCAKKFSGSSKDCKIQPLLCDKASGNSKGTKIYCAKKFSGSSKDCQIQSLLCDKASGNSKGTKIYCAKKISGSSKDCKIQSLLCDKASGNSKGSKIYCAKKFSGSSKDCKIQSLLCDKASGNSKGSKIHCRQKIFWAIGKLTCQNLCQYTVNTNLRPNGHTRAYSPENKTCKHTQT